jgi:hypothetical protein
MKHFEIKLKNGPTIWEGEAESVVDAFVQAMPVTYMYKIDLACLDLSGVPVVPDIDRAILAAIEVGGVLDMGNWHDSDPDEDGPCGTTHCRAGWAIHLAGEAGYALERKVDDPDIAGGLIYAASRPGVPIPSFFCSDAAAMADLRACAAAS